MTLTTQRRLNLGLAGDLLLTVLVVVAFSSVFALPTGLLRLVDYVVLAGASLAFLLIGIYGWKVWERTRSPSVAWVYFSVQLLLASSCWQPLSITGAMATPGCSCCPWPATASNCPDGGPWLSACCWWAQSPCPACSRPAC